MKYAILALTLLAVVAAYSVLESDVTEIDVNSGAVSLPEPVLKGGLSVEEALSSRRSVRSYSSGSATKGELGQMLWAAQGVTSEWGGRTAPSAGSTYPLETYVVVGDVEGLEPGVYEYDPKTHSIIQKNGGDLREALAREALGQGMISKAQFTIILSIAYERATGRYGERGVMYAHMEAGHAGQNIYLQAESLGLGTVAVGAFNPEGVAELLDIPEGETVAYLFPVGRR
ncbi:MAG: SagB/ThcOx family dehydrogenase [Candidatus Altiarchaeota archaeon]